MWKIVSNPALVDIDKLLGTHAPLSSYTRRKLRSGTAVYMRFRSGFDWEIVRYSLGDIFEEITSFFLRIKRTSEVIQYWHYQVR